VTGFTPALAFCSQHGSYPYHACPVCRVVACEHRHVLKLPPFQVSHRASLQLRQCAVCKAIGGVDQHGETRWMQEDLGRAPSTKG
jgi:hypothetical protein